MSAVRAWLRLLGRQAGQVRWQGLDLLCPPRCVFCRIDVPASADGQVVICSDCRRRLPGDGPRCLVCGGPVTAGAGCRRCRSGRKPDWDGIVVLAGYGDEVRDAVLAAKRTGGEPIAAGLARLLVERHREQLVAWDIDVVVPVPMHWMRRLARGTSSADGLARGVAARLKLPCRRLVVRSRATRMQNELPPEDRRANVRGAFRASPRSAGRRVLIVDDVTTTGGTLMACRAALAEAGAAAVYVAAVARADSLEPPAR